LPIFWRGDKRFSLARNQLAIGSLGIGRKRAENVVFVLRSRNYAGQLNKMAEKIRSEASLGEHLKEVRIISTVYNLDIGKVERSKE
jgi:hypothetical protein